MIDKLIVHWQKTAQSRSDYLTQGMIADWTEYRVLVHELKFAKEILKQLKALERGVETMDDIDDDDD